MFGTYLLVATLVGCAVMTVYQGWPTVSHIQRQLLPEYDYIIGIVALEFTAVSINYINVTGIYLEIKLTNI